MSVTIVATPGAANANSYLTVEEANAYFKSRVPLSTPWENVDDKSAALVMATRVINAVAVAKRMLSDGYYFTSRGWTGSPATAVQSLAWPRVGMYDMNGNVIPSDVIPQALKDATAELAGQLIISDTTLDNAASVQGVSSIRAGSVSIDFKDMISKHILPDAVWMLMPITWFTDEIYEPALRAQFDVIS